MTKWLDLLGISLLIEKCTQCGDSNSGLTETLSESMGKWKMLKYRSEKKSRLLGSSALLTHDCL